MLIKNEIGALENKIGTVRTLERKVETLENKVDTVCTLETKNMIIGYYIKVEYC